MSASLIILTAVVYLLLLFLIASYLGSERGKKMVNYPYTYALSLGVFCTAWTFYCCLGSGVPQSQILFLPVMVKAPLWAL